MKCWETRTTTTSHLNMRLCRIQVRFFLVFPFLFLCGAAGHAVVLQALRAAASIELKGFRCARAFFFFLFFLFPLSLCTGFVAHAGTVNTLDACF